MFDDGPIESVYLRSYLEPFAEWLEHEDVNEILVNRPGEVWLEIAGEPHMRRIDAPEVGDKLLARLAAQVARVTAQGVSRARPSLAASLPNGARLQMVGPPATRAHWALAIRQHRAVEVNLDSYARGPIAPRAPQPSAEALSAEARRAPIAFLREAVRTRKTILISGGTSSGKTTFLNALLKLVPANERIILIEDTPEIGPQHQNCVGLVAVKGDMGEARISVDDLLEASLRLRPDRLIVGEVRGREAASFLRAVNTGHPGSFTTIHASSVSGAFEQLALMLMQAGWALSRAETIAYARSVIDVIVQLSRNGGARRIEDIEAIGS